MKAFIIKLIYIYFISENHFKLIQVFPFFLINQGLNLFALNL